MPRTLTLALCLVLASCSRAAPARAPSPPAPPRPTPPGRFSVHEWGLFGFDMAGGTVEAASGTRPQIVPFGLGLTGTGTGKPVIYVHLDSGIETAELSLAIGLPARHVAEHHPFGALEPERLAFGRFVAQRGACGDARTPPSCRPGGNGNDADDGYCEAAEIPRYHGDDDVCLRASGAASEFLFYRGRALDGVTPPLSLRREGEAYALVPSATPIEGPVYFVERNPIGSVLYRALEPSERSGTITTERGLVDVTTVRASLLAHARTLGLTEREADAFVDAWAPAFFDDCHRDGPEAEGTAPRTLAAADVSLLYFAPRAMVDAAIPLTTEPPARAMHRAFLVRVVDGTRSSSPSDSLGLLGHSEVDYGFDRLSRGPMPRVQLEARPRAPRGLDRDAVRRVAQRNINQVRFCYERGLTQDSDLEGVVTIAIDVGPTGSVQTTSVDRTTVGDTVATCAANAARRWRFPVPTGAVPARVHFTFRLTYPG